MATLISRTPAELGVSAPRIATLRPPQHRALAWIASRKERFLLLNAPTGSRKSLIGRAAGAAMERQAVYLASDLALQEQFVREFPDARKLMGRSNYAPPDSGLLTCEDCDFRRGACSVCGLCPVGDGDADAGDHGHDRANCLGCPYARAKREADQAPFAALNTAYFLAEANHVGDFSRPDQLVVEDEADLLEGVLLEQVGIHLPPHRLARLKLNRLIRDGVERWIEEAHEHALAVAATEDQLERAQDDPREVSRHRREAEYWRNLAWRLETMGAELALEPRSWVQVGADRSDCVEFKPVFVRGHAQRLLWAHGTRFLLVSATLLAPYIYPRELGIPDGQWVS